MAFRGQHDHSLDPKDRITVPAVYRAALADGVVLMKGVEKCVEVWPRAAAEAMETAWLSPLNPMGADTRKIFRLKFASSDEVDLDSAGRIRVNKKLIEHAGLGGPSVIAGLGDHLELWSAEAWAAENEEIEAQAEELTERLAAQPPAGGTGAS